jgi:ribosome-associated protein
LDSNVLSKLAANAALDRRATDVLVLDMRELTIVCDFFVIASARNIIHSKAIADGIAERLEIEGRRARHIEGLPTATWVLMDYGDVVVHIFMPDERSYYNLERLWADAKVEQIESLVLDARQASNQTTLPEQEAETDK